MKAVLNGVVIAEAPKEELIFIERNWYFPPGSVKQELLQRSDTPYTCPWKGVCQYFDVHDAKTKTWHKDNAFCYPVPLPSAIEKVKKDFSGYVAFWQNVEVKE